MPSDAISVGSARVTESMVLMVTRTTPTRTSL
jgi:hypothetical protein